MHGKWPIDWHHNRMFDYFTYTSEITDFLDAVFCRLGDNSPSLRVIIWRLGLLQTL